MQRPELNNNNDNIIEVKNNILEEGIECFTHWLSAEEGNSEKNSYIQLTLKIFEKDNIIIIHDYFQNIDIEVKFDNGIPLCILCNTSECAHAGFAICVEQNLSCSNIYYSAIGRKLKFWKVIIY